MKDRFRLVRRFLLATAFAALMLVAAPAAQAGDTVKTRVDIRFEGVFEGTVKSQKQKCEVRRRVGLYEIRSGNTKRLDTDRTSKKDPNVSYPGVTAKPNRRYFLLADGRSAGSLECGRAKSERIKPVE